MANIEKFDSNLFVHRHPQHRGQIIVFQSHFRSVRIVAKNLWIDAVNVIVRQIQYRHVFTITEGIIRHFFNEIMAQIDFGQVDIFERLSLDLRNLVLGEINGVDKTEVSKHLKFNFGQLISSQINGTHSVKKQMSKVRKLIRVPLDKSAQFYTS